MNEKILVIEDDLALKPLWELISRRNFGPSNLDWAVSADEAEKLFQKSVQNNTPYALVVVDVFLSGSDTGLDFIKKTRSLGHKTPVILVSSISETDLKKTYDAVLNPVAVLTKPLSVPRCERLLESILSEKKDWNYL